MRSVRLHLGLTTMLHPRHFEVNEAWIAFQLNRAPICTEEDGNFNVLALMDAASCFMLSAVMIPVRSCEASATAAKELLTAGSRHNGSLPSTLFIASGQPASHVTSLAEKSGIAVVRVPESELAVFIREAREGFEEHVGGRRAQ